jgi:ribonuclease G
MFEVVITNWHEHLTAIGFYENKVELIDVLDSRDRTGNIYVGRVENIVSNLNAAFVRFEKDGGKHGIGFLPIKAIPVKNILNRSVDSSKEIRPGDIVLVQISVEEMKLKQARLTGKIDLAKADYNGDMDQLLAIARTRKEYQQISNEISGIADDIKNACDTMEKITGDTEYKLVTDMADIYQELLEGKDLFSENAVIEFYDEEEKRLALIVHYSLTSKTDDLFKKKVWLDSGAFLIIEQTETLNLIDVNSGKDLKKSEEFFLNLNKEAAREAYRQIRLRNLSGMILIDFVSLKNSETKDELIGYIKELIKDDPMNLTFIDMTKLGIIEFTREKRKKSLRETIDIKKM